MAAPYDLFINFQGHVTTAQVITLSSHYVQNFYGYFSYTSDSLFLQYIPMENDQVLETYFNQRFLLPEYGNARLHIDCIDSHHLNLSIGDRQWKLRKY